MSSAVAFSWGEMVSLENLVASGEVKLGRGKVISKIDIQNNPGPYPIYSSSSKNDGKMGEYGDYMFDEEMISWSVDGGGYFFHRPKHKFSVTNVSGYMRLNSDWDYKFTAYSFQFQHGYFSFDYQTKAHPSVIREFYFLPKIPVAEQQKIATILSSVDNVIEKTRAQIDKLKDLKTGMMQELLTKGIGHTEFKDSPVGRIPVEWEVLALESIVESIVDCEHKTAPYVENSEFLVVRTSNVRDGVIVYDDMRFTTGEAFREWTKRAVPTGGDVLFTREAPAGESCMVPAGVKICMGQRMVLLRPKVDKVYPDYFSLYLTSEAAKLAIYELSIGTTVTRINIEDIKRIPCVVPPVKEQREIHLKVSSVQSVITKKELFLSSSESIKKALMQDLLTGKVRVKLSGELKGK